MSQDLSEMLQSFLGTKEGQEQLKSVAEMFGSDDSGGGPDLSQLDLSKLNDMLGGEDSEKEHEEKHNEESTAQSDIGGFDINMLSQIQGMMGKMKNDDKNTDLIKALKPHLKPERRKKADDAMKIMRLISMIPLLKESGLFGEEGGLLDSLFK